MSELYHKIMSRLFWKLWWGWHTTLRKLFVWWCDLNTKKEQEKAAFHNEIYMECWELQRKEGSTRKKPKLLSLKRRPWGQYSTARLPAWCPCCNNGSGITNGFVPKRWMHWQTDVCEWLEGAARYHSYGWQDSESWACEGGAYNNKT